MDPIVHSFGGSALDRYLFDYEVPDGGGAPDGGAASDSGGGGAAPAESDTGAAADVEAGAGTPAAPSIDWDAPETAAALDARLNATIEARETAAAEAARQAELATQQNGRASALEEKLALLDITPDELRDFFGEANKPLAEAAQRMQQQESVKQIDGLLAGLGTAHPDLLGDGVAKVAELVDSEGKPLFSPDEVGDANRNAVLFAASALDQMVRSQGRTIDQGAALTEAAKQVSERDTLVGKIAVERYKQELAGTGNAPRDLAGGGAGLSRLSGVEGGDEMAIARRMIAERDAANGR